jgi:trans-aconitate 2-methyltransferase
VKLNKTDRWDAETYSKNSNIQFSHALSILNGYNFRGDETILDIGCGDGKITRQIADCVPRGHVVGLDNSSDMLNFAKQQYGACSKLEFVQANAEDFSLDKKFDLVVSFSTLHWIENQYGVFSSIKKCLKPGGQVRAMLYPKCEYQWAAINDVITRPKWAEFFKGYKNPYNFYDDVLYKNLLTELGYTILKIEVTESVDINFDDIGKLCDFMKSWLPHYSVVPIDWRENFIQEVCFLYIKNLGQIRQSTINIPFRRIELLASV